MIVASGTYSSSLAVTIVETLAHNLVVINLASAMMPCTFDLVVEHRINWVGRVESGTLSDEVLLSSLEILQWVVSALLDQIFENASTR